jgi:aerobic-type carbon monoxide dehydrogenase small subunit (CoxS/CutS family)
MERRLKKVLIELMVNGEAYELAVEPQETLLEVLRDDLGFTGTKEGCETGECGSCTVLVDGAPMLSCLMLAVACQGKDIATIEGLAEGSVRTGIQQAFLDKGAVQCGFCTPGMILATTALESDSPHPSHQEIQEALEGHLCRCTGYNKIVEAVKAATEKG